MPRSALQAVAADGLEETLAAIARLRIAKLATPVAVKLQRILSLVVGGPARLIVSGNKLDPAEVDTHIRFALDLFLHGIAGPQRGGPPI